MATITHRQAEIMIIEATDSRLRVRVRHAGVDYRVSETEAIARVADDGLMFDEIDIEPGDSIMLAPGAHVLAIEELTDDTEAADAASLDPDDKVTQ
ncbi:MAG: hypothetical protein ACOYBR_09725 [Fluviibacter sp.]